MANPEHVEMLLNGASALHRWRLDNWITRLELSGADLRDSNLQGINLRGANLREANLQGASLQGADIQEADLRGAYLMGASLHRTNLYRTEFHNVNLRGAYLMDAYLIFANFHKADLRDSNLHNANLTNAYLQGATLQDAVLQKADLRHTDLQGVDFQRCNLHDANLQGANLQDANLQSANLTSADFQDADLQGADFTKASVGNTQFDNVNLNLVIGLESVKHLAPSGIGVNTLFLSQGHIPEVFLRGCGVPEEFISYIPSFTNRPIEFYSCFICYSHPDAAFARQLHDFLQGRGIRCWLAEKQLLLGHDLHDEVDRGIKMWDKVLLCASEASLKSWWVDKEITHAFAKESKLTECKGHKVRSLIPLDLDGFLFNGWESGKADEVKERVVADFTGWGHDNQKMQEQFERVLKALRADEGREIPPRSMY